jgi:hypothetical protein
VKVRSRLFFIAILLLFLALLAFLFFNKTSLFESSLDQVELPFNWGKKTKNKISVNNYNSKYVVSITSGESDEALVEYFKENYNLTIDSIKIEVVDHQVTMNRHMILPDGRTVPVVGYGIPNLKEQLDQSNNKNGHHIAIQLYIDEEADKWLKTNNEVLEDSIEFQFILALVDYATRDPLNMPFGQEAVEVRELNTRNTATGILQYVRAYKRTRLFGIQRN